MRTIMSFDKIKLISILTATAVVFGCSDENEPAKVIVFEPDKVSQNTQTRNFQESEPGLNSVDNNDSTEVTPNVVVSDNHTNTDRQSDDDEGAGLAGISAVDVDSDIKTGSETKFSKLNSTENDYNSEYPDAELVLNVSGDSGGLSWTPQNDSSYEQSYENINVVVAAANGQHIIKSFSNGEEMTLIGEFTDGSYTWEAKGTPYIYPEIREEMRAMHESGDLQAEEKLIARLRAEGQIPTKEQIEKNATSGHFRVLNGEVVTSDLDEKG